MGVEEVVQLALVAESQPREEPGKGQEEGAVAERIVKAVDVEVARVGQIQPPIHPPPGTEVLQLEHLLPALPAEVSPAL